MRKSIKYFLISILYVLVFQWTFPIYSVWEDFFLVLAVSFHMEKIFIDFTQETALTFLSHFPLGGGLTSSGRI